MLLCDGKGPQHYLPDLKVECMCTCSKPVKRAELLARISAHLRVKADATWVHSLVNGAMQVRHHLCIALAAAMQVPTVTCMCHVPRE